MKEFNNTPPPPEGDGERLWMEGEDYYLNEKGLMVLTAKHHLKRGYCCGMGCMHCPYNYEAVPEPKRSLLIAGKNTNENKPSI